MVAEVGAQAATMNAIAHHAGVGKPTIYLRWPNAEAVVAAAFDELAMSEETAEAYRAASEALERLRGLEHGAFLAATLTSPHTGAGPEADGAAPRG